ncbi:WD40-repeat-containing domain protein [Apodospora peruviana]|uniref:WD40-repeat-containing domain protein n=1 Tax=Apodospora peruviana TaxID=516989 RepID=A0AAE0M800_9PEZI|nr:WD40-repeat-containing domain protein [Apodospora peruviana]
MERHDRRIVQMSDWAPAQEAIFGESASSSSTKAASLQDETESGGPSQPRLRSKSVSPPWVSPFFHDDDGNNRNLALAKSKSHGFGHSNDEPGPVRAPPPKTSHHSFTRILRRASLSLKSGVKGFVHRRTSVPLSDVFDNEGQPQRPPFVNSSHWATARPTTSHSTWHRLRQATSFHRHSRMLYSGHGERTFETDPIESPTFPVPGSGEQPPIIPRNTGAAARQAAASACNGLQGYDFMAAPVPRPGWLGEEGLDDHESGIGIALTSSEVEAFVPQDGTDSDVDVDVASGEDETDIVKVDFISRLPIELAIQVLAQLDAATLATASRVSRNWFEVVKNQHIWRESFLREKTGTYATSGPVKPGAGLGVPTVQPSNNWKEIYRVKQELDERWKEGKSRSVYLHGHSDSIYCLQFDESKIITGSRDKTIRVWDMHTFACKLVIGPPDVINDPALLLLHQEDGAAVHYATIADTDAGLDANGQPKAQERRHHSIPTLYSPSTHHKASILCLQYDNKILVTGSSDSSCIVYDLHAGYRPIRRLQYHSAAVLDLVFDEKHIVTCSKDVSICVWDRATGNLLKQLRGHSGPVNAVQMRGNTIVSCSGDFRVKLWNIDTGKNIREFLGHSKGLACSQFSEDGRYVASAGNDKVIRVWDANTGECVRAMKAHDKLVRSLHVDSVSGRLVSGSYDTDIKVWDMETGAQLLHFPKWHNSWVLSAKSDYRRIVSSGQDPKIVIMDFGADVEGIEMLESGLRIPEMGRASANSMFPVGDVAQAGAEVKQVETTGSWEFI